MPRVALPDSLQPCRISGCLYTPYNQDWCYFASLIIDRLPTLQLHLRHHRRFLHSTHLSRPCWVSSDTRHCCLRPLRGRHAYKSLPEVGPSRLLAAMLGDLSVSSLRSIKTMTQFSSLLSIKIAMLPASMLGYYSTSASSTPCCFPRRIDLLGNLFLITSLLDLLFLLFFFFGLSYRPSCPPWFSDTTHECIFDALWIFSSSFRSIGSLLPIGRHSTSLHSARLKTGRLQSWLVLFSFLDWRACYSTYW
jgi:hypothetical protein